MGGGRWGESFLDRRFLNIHTIGMSYHIARDGQQLGVFAEQEVQSGVTTGRFLSTDLFWTEGHGGMAAAEFALPVMIDSKTSVEGDSVPVGSVICFILAALGFVGLTIYNVVLLTKQGQTIAKKWLGIRIVTHPDGQNPGFVKAFLLRSFVNAIIAQVVPLYGIVDVCFIFREDQRCLHDLIGETVVVQV
jgi:uncharacterized RDD family membrane protein YckC